VSTTQEKRFTRFVSGETFLQPDSRSGWNLETGWNRRSIAEEAQKKTQ